MGSLRAKVLLGFGVVLSLLVVMATVSFYFISHYNKTVEKVVTDDVNLLIADLQLNTNMQTHMALVREFMLTGNTDYIARFEQTTKESITYQEYVLRHNNSDEVKQLVDKSVAWRNLVQDTVLPTYLKGDKESALHILEHEVTPIGRELTDSFKALADQRKTIIEDKGKETIEGGVFLEMIIAVISFIAVALGVATALYMARMIVRPILAAVQRMTAVAGGDLRGEELAVSTKDETAQLIHALNQMGKDLRHLISQINDTALQVAASSEQLTASAEQTTLATESIASTIQEVAAGSEDQLESIESSAEPMNDMVIGVRHIASRAAQVSQTSQEASEKSAFGHASVQNAMEQMHSISRKVAALETAVSGLGARSQQIGDIVDVITEIAAQTNLLSLNASIEAARAGEQGRGFAVVANEVKKLAEQSAQSAGQISKLISVITAETRKTVASMKEVSSEVSGGVAVFRSVGDAFETIDHAISEVHHQIQDVSATASQMTTGTDDVSRSMAHITSIAQETAAGTQNVAAAMEEQLATMEEVASSAAALSHTAEELQRLVGRFRT